MISTVDNRQEVLINVLEQDSSQYRGRVYRLIHNPFIQLRFIDLLFISCAVTGLMMFSACSNSRCNEEIKQSGLILWVIGSQGFFIVQRYRIC
jgi:hypothetical protein